MKYRQYRNSTVCSCHFTYAFQSESTLYSCLNIKELLAQSRCEIRGLSDCNCTRTQNHLVRKRTLKNLAKLFVYELSGSGFERKGKKVKKYMERYKDIYLKKSPNRALSTLTVNGQFLTKPQEMANALMMKMMMNCFCGMVGRRKAFNLISSRDHCQRSSPSRISDTPRVGLEPAQNLSSGLVE